MSDDKYDSGHKPSVPIPAGSPQDPRLNGFPARPGVAQTAPDQAAAQARHPAGQAEGRGGQWKERAARAAEHDRQVREGLAGAVRLLTGPKPPAGHIAVQSAAAAHADGGAQ